jgi:hypothetical protein
MAVHIGEKIRQRAKELRVGPTELGKKIHTSKQNITGIYKRRTIDAELLAKFSKVLQYDFFRYYQPEGSLHAAEEAGVYLKKNRQAEEIRKLKKELEDLREKYELLKRLNTLLEKKKR